MNKSRLLAAICACVLVTATSSTLANSVLPLEGRLPLTQGGTDYQAYYDPNLDITWAADANLPDGGMYWDAANAWAISVSIGGVDGWRLPNMDVNGDGILVNCWGGGVVDCDDNEMGYLYWEEGITGATPGPFTNLFYNSSWWSETQLPNTDLYGLFGFSSGAQHGSEPSQTAYLAWAVHDGDISAIPLPAAIWLFGFGLLGLIGIAKRKNKF